MQARQNERKLLYIKRFKEIMNDPKLINEAVKGAGFIRNKDVIKDAPKTSQYRSFTDIVLFDQDGAPVQSEFNNNNLVLDTKRSGQKALEARGIENHNLSDKEALIIIAVSGAAFGDVMGLRRDLFTLDQGNLNDNDFIDQQRIDQTNIQNLEKEMLSLLFSNQTFDTGLKSTDNKLEISQDLKNKIETVEALMMQEDLKYFKNLTIPNSLSTLTIPNSESTFGETGIPSNFFTDTKIKPSEVVDLVLANVNSKEIQQNFIKYIDSNFDRIKLSLKNDKQFKSAFIECVNKIETASSSKIIKNMSDIKNLSGELKDLVNQVGITDLLQKQIKNDPENPFSKMELKTNELTQAVKLMVLGDDKQINNLFSFAKKTKKNGDFATYQAILTGLQAHSGANEKIKKFLEKNKFSTKPFDVDLKNKERDKKNEKEIIKVPMLNNYSTDFQRVMDSLDKSRPIDVSMIKTIANVDGIIKKGGSIDEKINFIADLKEKKQDATALNFLIHLALNHPDDLNNEKIKDQLIDSLKKIDKHYERNILNLLSYVSPNFKSNDAFKNLSQLIKEHNPELFKVLPVYVNKIDNTNTLEVIAATKSGLIYGLLNDDKVINSFINSEEEKLKFKSEIGRIYQAKDKIQILQNILNLNIIFLNLDQNQKLTSLIHQKNDYLNDVINKLPPSFSQNNLSSRIQSYERTKEYPINDPLKPELNDNHITLPKEDKRKSPEPIEIKESDQLSIKENIEQTPIEQTPIEKSPIEQAKVKAETVDNKIPDADRYIKLLRIVVENSRSKEFWSDKANTGMPGGVKKILNILQDNNLDNDGKFKAVQSELSIRLKDESKKRHPAVQELYQDLHNLLKKPDANKLAEMEKSVNTTDKKHKFESNYILQLKIKHEMPLLLRHGPLKHADNHEKLIDFSDRLTSVYGFDNTIVESSIKKGLADVLGLNSKQLTDYILDCASNNNDLKPEVKMKVEVIMKFKECLDQLKGKSESVKGLKETMNNMLIGKLDEGNINKIYNNIQQFQHQNNGRAFDPITLFQKNAGDPKTCLGQLNQLAKNMEGSKIKVALDNTKEIINSYTEKITPTFRR